MHIISECHHDATVTDMENDKSIHTTIIDAWSFLLDEKLTRRGIASNPFTCLINPALGIT